VEDKKEPGASPGSFDDHLTTARTGSGERVFHCSRGGVAHARHDVGICVQSYRYCGVAEEFLNELRVDATRQESSQTSSVLYGEEKKSV
jgi:hypothetical protein